MVPSHAMQQKSLSQKSPEEWQEIWVKKSGKILKEQHIPSEQKSLFLEHIKDFLTEFPGYPHYIQWERNLILVKGKGNKQRQVMLDPFIASELKDYLEFYNNNIYIFEGATKGKPYSRRTIQKIYENACKKARIKRKGGIHTLRHSFATHLLEQGVSLRFIQKLLGHSSSKSTEIYTHVATDQIRKIKSPIAGMIKKK